MNDRETLQAIVAMCNAQLANSQGSGIPTPIVDTKPNEPTPKPVDPVINPVPPPNLDGKPELSYQDFANARVSNVTLANLILNLGRGLTTKEWALAERAGFEYNATLDPSGIRGNPTTLTPGTRPNTDTPVINNSGGSPASNVPSQDPIEYDKNSATMPWFTRDNGGRLSYVHGSGETKYFTVPENYVGIVMIDLVANTDSQHENMYASLDNGPEVKLMSNGGTTHNVPLAPGMHTYRVRLDKPGGATVVMRHFP